MSAKRNLPRRVLDGLVKQFVTAKRADLDDRDAIYTVAQRVLRLIGQAAVRRAQCELSCSICGETVKTLKGHDYYLDHTEDCPLSWIDQIKL